MKITALIVIAILAAACVSILLTNKTLFCTAIESMQTGKNNESQAKDTATREQNVSLNESDQAYERKDKLVQELKRNAYFYDCESDIYGFISVTFTILIAVATAATAFLIAIDFAKDSTGRRAVLTGLPILSGLLATLLSQFHVQELWRLREVGRIQSLSLMDEVHALPTAPTDVEMRTTLLEFQKKQRDIEREQATAFFSYVFTNVAPATDANKLEHDTAGSKAAANGVDGQKAE